MTIKQNNKADPGTLIVIVLVSLVVASVIILIILQVFFTLVKDSFGREIGNTLLQIISVGVIGTFLSLLLAKYNHQKNELLRIQELNRISEENKNQFRKDILSQLNKIYSAVKSTRRMLRAKAFSTPYYKAIKTDDTRINLEIYDNALEDINAFQLQLEIILKEIETNQNIFKNYNIIYNPISAMGKYLGKLVTEYEDNRAKVLGDPPSLIIKDLKNIKQMLDHADETNQFKTKFIEPYKDAISEVRKELLTETQIE